MSFHGQHLINFISEFNTCSARFPSSNAETNQSYTPPSFEKKYEITYVQIVCKIC